MKRLLTTVTLLTLLAVPFGATATAGTDQATFDKLVAKVAATAADLLARFKPRFACACFDFMPANPGVVVSDGLGKVRCGQPFFAADGVIAGMTFCNAFEVLGR